MQIIEIIKAVILGLIEGVTEWLPISSTGHMILADEFIRLDVSPAFREMFFVVIQLGAIFAVVVLYWKRLCPPSFWKKPALRRETFSLWGRILVACIPAGIVGLLFDDQMDALFYNYQTVAAALIVYGVLFIVIERGGQGRQPKINTLSAISWKTALFIGVFQLLALIPGTSRSGATILGAVLLGASRTVAAEFTFFLAIPVMLGASLVKLANFGLTFTGAEAAILLTGSAVAFLVSIVAIRFLVGYVKRHDFKAFGWYRIILGGIVLAYFLITG